MPPDSASAYAPDRAVCYAEARRDLALRALGGANGCYLGRGQLADREAAVAALGHLVGHVVRVCAEKEVVEPTARWVVAAVKDVQLGLAVGGCPNEPMS